MATNNAVSVIVPTLNEAENIPELFRRIDDNLSAQSIPYEIIIIDDHSSDQTIAVAKSYAKQYHVRTALKRGKQGKAYSLLEGFEAAKNPVICMIDADLQYPPEAISPMHNLLTETDADVVISERYNKETSFVRKLSSKVFNFFFARLLFGISYDTQSGLKLFRKEILQDFTLSPSPWSFDLEFLVRALENKRSIISYAIPFTERSAGDTKVKLLSTTFELAKASIKLRINTSVQELRAGHRANSRFYKRAFPTMMLAVAMTVALQFSVQTPASALSISTSPLNVNVNSSLQPLVDSITASLQGNRQPAAQIPVNTPTATVNPVASAPASTANTSTTASNQPATSSNSTASGTTAQTTSTVTAVGSPNGSSGQVLGASTFNTDTTKLAAATSPNATTSFANGYPTTSLSDNSRSVLSTITTGALFAGALCLIAAIIAITSKRLKPQRQHVR